MRIWLSLLALLLCVASPAHAEDASAWAPRAEEKPKAWIERLTKGLGSEASVGQRTAIYVAARDVGSKLAIKLLLSRLGTEKNDDAALALGDAMAGIGGRSLAGDVARLAKKAKPDQITHRTIVLTCFAALRRPDSAEPEGPWLRVVDALLDTGARSQQEALLERFETLGTSGTAAIGRALQHEDPLVQLKAIEILRKRKDDWRAAEALAEGLAKRPKILMSKLPDLRARTKKSGDKPRAWTKREQEALNWYFRFDALS